METGTCAEIWEYVIRIEKETGMESLMYPGMGTLMQESKLQWINKGINIKLFIVLQLELAY